MAFPTTSVLDDFNRADGGLGSNWGAPAFPGHGTPTVWTNAMVAPGSTWSNAYWSAATYQDCEVYATMTHDTGMRVMARLSDPGGTSVDYIDAIFRVDNDTIELYWGIDWSDVGSWGPTTYTISDGDQCGLRVTNDGDDIVVEIYVNGTLAHTETITGGVTSYPTLAAAGYIGAGHYGGGNNLSRSLDNFGGGTYSATQTITASAVVHTRAIGTATVDRDQQVAVPSADSVDGAWTDQAGGTSLAVAIDETTPSDSDYIRSEVGPSNSGCRVKLASLTDPTSSVAHEIHWRAGKDFVSGPQINMTVKLYQGGGDSQGAGTLIASFTRNDVQAFATYVETLSGAEADSITNYADLYLEFFANQV